LLRHIPAAAIFPQPEQLWKNSEALTHIDLEELSRAF
jgi:hypothetical protein